jgi:hypothetical protein
VHTQAAGRKGSAVGNESVESLRARAEHAEAHAKMFAAQAAMAEATENLAKARVKRSSTTSNTALLSGE